MAGDLKTNLAGAYRLEETGSANRVDSSPRGNHLPAVNSPGNAAGKIGNGIYLTQPTPSAFCLLTGVTDWAATNGKLWISAWVKMLSDGTGQRSFALVLRASDSKNLLAIGYVHGSGFKATCTGLDSLGKQVIDTSLGPANVGDWHLVNVWVDGPGQTLNVKVDNLATVTLALGQNLADPSTSRQIQLGGSGATIDAVLDVLYLWDGRIPDATDLAGTWNGGAGVDLFPPSTISSRRHAFWGNRRVAA